VILAYLINQYPQPSQTFIRREIAALEQQGIQVHRFTLRRWDGKLADEADLQEQRRTRAVLETGASGLLLGALITLFTRPIRFLRAILLAMRSARKSERGRLVHFIYLAEACVLRRWLARCGAQHLHAHFGTNSTTVAMLCHTLGGPHYSFTVHGPEEFHKAPLLALTPKIEHAAFVVAISNFGKTQLQRYCDPQHWPKIHVVHCGVDQLFLNADSAPPAASSRLVCVGRLQQQKGHLLLLRAVAQVLASGLDFMLKIVGDGPMRPDIEQLIKELKLHTHVQLLGWLSNTEVRQQILASRALVLPSFAEGVPVVIMEALALKRPVIATSVGGVPELVVHGQSGWIVPPGNVQALTQVMREALTAAPEQLQQMGEAGAAYVAKAHDARIQAAKLAQLIQSTIQNVLP
jgi:glycosyltransferase involved in cell wall biosynthesis